MSTSYSIPIKAFYKLIEKDRTYFNYFGVDDVIALAIAKERALGYLGNAVGRIMLECQPSVDFNNKDDSLEIFNFDFTAQEILLISSLMYEYYLNGDIAYLKTQAVNYTAPELKVFDPSNARSTFMEMYMAVCENNKHLIEEYSNKDRKTGKFTGIDYTTENVDVSE